MNVKDLTGSKVGKLMLLERKRENDKTYYYCKCDCGNKKWIRADALTKKNPTLSCGCLAKETQFKAIDIKNKRFGRLVALKATDKRDNNNGSVIWKCKCDCGNISYAPINNLVDGAIVSCGCYKKEYQRNHGKSIGELHVKNNIICDTNLQVISTDKPMAHNTSGVKGVSYQASRGKWMAQIWFKKKFYFLGRYDKKEDAIKARKEAEERLHKEFLNTLKNK